MHHFLTCILGLYNTKLTCAALAQQEEADSVEKVKSPEQKNYSVYETALVTCTKVSVGGGRTFVLSDMLQNLKSQQQSRRREEQQ